MPQGGVFPLTCLDLFVTLAPMHTCSIRLLFQRQVKTLKTLSLTPEVPRGPGRTTEPHELAPANFPLLNLPLGIHLKDLCNKSSKRIKAHQKSTLSLQEEYSERLHLAYERSSAKECIEPAREVQQVDSTGDPITQEKGTHEKGSQCLGEQGTRATRSTRKPCTAKAGFSHPDREADYLPVMPLRPAEYLSVKPVGEAEYLPMKPLGPGLQPD